MVVIFTADKGAIREIEYSFSQTTYGEMLTAWTKGWLCYATFTEYLTREVALDELKRLFPKATLQPTNREEDITTTRPGRLLLAGTRLRHDVWRALLKTERGSTLSYSALASLIDRPTAVRAVATGVGCNPVNVVVPCHRVVPARGGIGNYHSGADIKRRLLADEA